MIKVLLGLSLLVKGRLGLRLSWLLVPLDYMQFLKAPLPLIFLLFFLSNDIVKQEILLVLSLLSLL